MCSSDLWVSAILAQRIPAMRPQAESMHCEVSRRVIVPPIMLIFLVLVVTLHNSPWPQSPHVLRSHFTAQIFGVGTRCKTPTGHFCRNEVFHDIYARTYRICSLTPLLIIMTVWLVAHDDIYDSQSLLSRLAAACLLKSGGCKAFSGSGTRPSRT